jgi:hypothetical protein
MGKPDVAVYDKFREKYMRLNEEIGKNQFLVPYLMSSHPGSTMDDAAELALYTKRIGLAPEQVQDFYPTPGTASTVMFYTGIDPFTGKPIYTATSYREKQLQRALLQWRRPENRRMIYEAMNYCSERGKEMLKELLSGRPQGERKQDKNGKPAPVGSKQKRTEQGSEKKQPNKPAEKAACASISRLSTSAVTRDRILCTLVFRSIRIARKPVKANSTAGRTAFRQNPRIKPDWTPPRSENSVYKIESKPRSP